MNPAEDFKSQVEQLQTEVKSYVDTTVHYYKLLGFKIAMKSTTMIVKTLLVVLFMSMFFMFVSIALAFALGSYLENTALGFLIVAGFYFLGGMVFMMIKETVIEGPILERFSKIFFNE